MSYNRIMKHQKNGFDIIAKVFGAGENTYANILYKPYGEEKYIYIGEIYKTTTAACGTTRDTVTWHHRRAESPIQKTSWHDAAKKLYADWRQNAQATV